MTSIFPELADLGAKDEGTAAVMPSVRGTTWQRRSEITFVCGNVSNPIPQWKKPAALPLPSPRRQSDGRFSTLALRSN